MLISTISKAVASNIARELTLSVEKQEVIEYGMKGLLSQGLTLGLLLLTGLILHILKEVIILGFCGAFLRKYSGGVHCSSPLRCALLSMIVVPMLVFLARWVFTLGFFIDILFIIIISLISLVIFYMKAPKDSPEKPIKNKDRIRKLKYKSVTLLICFFIASLLMAYLNFGQVSLLIVIGSLNQAVTLTKPGYIYVKWFDEKLKLVGI